MQPIFDRSFCLLSNGRQLRSIGGSAFDWPVARSILLEQIMCPIVVVRPKEDADRREEPTDKIEQLLL